MKKYCQEVEVSGHLIDSMILTKIFDKIMNRGGEFEILELTVGKKKKDSSFAKLLVTGKNEKHLKEITDDIHRDGAIPHNEKQVKLKKASKDMVLPDNFYSTTNNDTSIFHNNLWIQVENQMMDKCIVVKKNRAFCVPIREVKKAIL